MFLLLDLRTLEEHTAWHIKESINFPAVNIARDKTIPELFRFKNAQDKLIIIYMLDERAGVAQAALLSEKGYDNVFLLSGGCEAFLDDYADLVEGENIPVSKKQLAREADAKAQEKKDKIRAKRSNLAMSTVGTNYR